MSDNPNPSKYQKTTIPPPPGTSGPGTHGVYIPAHGINGYVVNGVLYNIKPAAAKQLEIKKQSGKNGYGWEFPK